MSFIRKVMEKRKEKPALPEGYIEEVENLARKREALLQEQSSNPSLYLKKREFEQKLRFHCTQVERCPEFEDCFDRDTLTYNWNLIEKCPKSEARKMLEEFKTEQLVTEGEERKRAEELQAAVQRELTQAMSDMDKRAGVFRAQEVYGDYGGRPQWFEEVAAQYKKLTENPVAHDPQLLEAMQKFIESFEASTVAKKAEVRAKEEGILFDSRSDQTLYEAEQAREDDLTEILDTTRRRSEFQARKRRQQEEDEEE